MGLCPNLSRSMPPDDARDEHRDREWRQDRAAVLDAHAQHRLGERRHEHHGAHHAEEEHHDGQVQREDVAFKQDLHVQDGLWRTRSYQYSNMPSSQRATNSGNTVMSVSGRLSSRLRPSTSAARPTPSIAAPTISMWCFVSP